MKLSQWQLSFFSSFALLALGSAVGVIVAIVRQLARLAYWLYTCVPLPWYGRTAVVAVVFAVLSAVWATVVEQEMGD